MDWQLDGIIQLLHFKISFELPEPQIDTVQQIVMLFEEFENVKKLCENKETEVLKKFVQSFEKENYNYTKQIPLCIYQQEMWLLKGMLANYCGLFETALDNFLKVLEFTEIAKLEVVTKANGEIKSLVIELLRIIEENEYFGGKVDSSDLNKLVEMSGDSYDFTFEDFLPVRFVFLIITAGIKQNDLINSFKFVKEFIAGTVGLGDCFVVLSFDEEMKIVIPEQVKDLETIAKLSKINFTFTETEPRYKLYEKCMVDLESIFTSTRERKDTRIILLVDSLRKEEAEQVKIFAEKKENLKVIVLVNKKIGFHFNGGREMLVTNENKITEIDFIAKRKGN